MNILSIQSHVVYGHAGNAAAVFPMQRLGANVWPIHTVQFSNHTEYGDWTGQIHEAEHLRQLLDGLAARDAFARCSAVLSGYMGDVSLGQVILDAVERARRANPAALYLCDPVMGNPEKGCVVRPEIPPFMAGQTVPAADITTPSLMELEQLSGGRTLDTLPEVLNAVEALRESGPRIVLVKGLGQLAPDSGEETMLAVDEHNTPWQVRTPKLALPRHLVGAGDVVAGVFLVEYLRQRSVPLALEHAASAMYAVAEANLAAGAWELQLVAAQDQIAHPRKRFRAERLD